MLIGIVGFMGSGKGTVGEMLVAKGFVADSFAKPLKDCVSIIYNWDRELLEGITKVSREWRERPDPYWSKVYGYDFTPRLALQLFGAACRDRLHNNIWCESLVTRMGWIDNIVITDVRYRNEIEYIKKLGGKIVRIQRGNNPVWFDELFDIEDSILREKFMKQFNIHISEWDWIGTDYDYVISNDGTIRDLEFNVVEILKLMRG